MKDENIEILGSYRHYDGGIINFSMGKNLKLKTEINTYIHEIYHMYLTNSSNLGFFMLLLEKESDLALEANDHQHNNRVKELSDMIFNRTILVQEVYANSQELLWIEKNLGMDTKNRLFLAKPKKYQDYCNKMNFITNDQNLSFEEKQYWIEKMCKYALNIPISSNEFLIALRSIQKLKIYFLEHHPNKRLEESISKYNLNKSLQSEEEELKINNFLSDLRSLKIIKYFDQELPEFGQIKKDFMKNGQLDKVKVEEFMKSSYRKMEVKIKLFDLSNMKVSRVNKLNEYLDYGIFVIKNSGNLSDNHNLYAIAQSTNKEDLIYVSDEVNPSFIINEKIKVIGISGYEYDIDKLKPMYIQIDIPIVVIIEDYMEAKLIIGNIYRNRELLIGDLYERDVNNFSTLLFFRERTNPNIIFVFPTLKKLANRILNEVGVHKNLVYAKDENFKKIFSVFKNEAEMLAFTKWIFSFIMQSSCKFTDFDDPATKMSFDITSALLDSVFQIRIPDYFNIWAALPTEKTNGEPFYALMEVKDDINTGAFYSNSDNIILFKNKSVATRFKSNIKDDKLRVVGIDKFYWNIAKNHFKKIGLKFAICNRASSSLAETISIEKLNSIIN